MSLSTQDINTLNEIFSKMDRNDFNIAANIYKHWQGMLQHNAAIAFRIGDKVKWNSKYGRIEQGTITKVNSKTIKVTTTSNQMWNVSPSLLSKI
jgi:nitrate reductase alpha subunit